MPILEPYIHSMSKRLKRPSFNIAAAPAPIRDHFNLTMTKAAAGIAFSLIGWVGACRPSFRHPRAFRCDAK